MQYHQENENFNEMCEDAIIWRNFALSVTFIYLNAS